MKLAVSYGHISSHSPANARGRSERMRAFLSQAFVALLTLVFTVGVMAALLVASERTADVGISPHRTDPEVPSPSTQPWV